MKAIPDYLSSGRGAGNRHCGVLMGIVAMVCVLLLAVGQGWSDDDLWQITFYCANKCCTGKYADGYFASGKKVYEGGCAINWIPFGTKVEIEGMGIYTVEDRGAKSLFGDKNNHIKHIDIYINDHEKTRRLGVQWKRVKVIKQIAKGGK